MITAEEAIGILKTCNYLTPLGRKSISELIQGQQAEIERLSREVNELHRGEGSSE